MEAGYDEILTRSKTNEGTNLAFGTRGIVNPFGEVRARALSDALKTNTAANLCSFDNCLGPKECRLLVPGLTQNSSLTALTLVRNRIGTQGAMALGEVLTESHQSSALRRLSLKRTDGPKEYARLWSRQQGKPTPMSDAHEVGQLGVFALARAVGVSRLERLELVEPCLTDAVSETFAQHIAKCETLQSLKISSYNFADQGAAALAAILPACRLKNLELTSCKIGPQGALALAKVLPRATSLRRLSLTNNRLGDEGGVFLGKALAGGSLVHTVDLARNGLGDAAAKAIAEALKVTNSLTRLILRYNNITGAGLLDLANALSVAQSISTFDVRDNNTHPPYGTSAEMTAGDKALLAALKANTRLVYAHADSDSRAMEMLDAEQAKNRLLRLKARAQWTRVAPLVGWRRANGGSPIESSIWDLLPTIAAFTTDCDHVALFHNWHGSLQGGSQASSSSDAKREEGKPAPSNYSIDPSRIMEEMMLDLHSSGSLFTHISQETIRQYHSEDKSRPLSGIKEALAQRFMDTEWFDRLAEEPSQPCLDADAWTM